MQDQLAIAAIVRCILRPHQSLLCKQVARATSLIGSVVVEQKPPLCRTLLPLIRLFQEFGRDLEDHLEVQETSLVPHLLALEAALHKGERAASSADEVSEGLRLLKYGQVSLTGVLEEMSELTHGFTAPPGVCQCYGELLNVLAAIQSEVASEVRMETTMLGAQAAGMLERARHAATLERAGHLRGLEAAHFV